jgi:succinate dehydrogenase / fumarate reductase cytochrome b subunit
MTEAKADAGGPKIVRPKLAARPLSPHALSWRWHLTMAVSILHRFTGVALYGGALILAAWAVALAYGPDGYDRFRALAGSPLGVLILVGLTFAVFYHLANGVRHLVWDAGAGFAPRTADATAAAVIAFAVAATVAVWVAAILIGGPR